MTTTNPTYPPGVREAALQLAKSWGMDYENGFDLRIEAASDIIARCTRVAEKDAVIISLIEQLQRATRMVRSQMRKDFMLTVTEARRAMTDAQGGE